MRNRAHLRLLLGSVCGFILSCASAPDNRAAVDQADVLRSFRASAEAYKHCFRAASKRKRGLYGRLVFDFYIDKEGFVERELIDRKKSNFPPYPPFDSCALGVLKTQQFNKPRHGKPVQVFHPLTFSKNRKNK